MNSKTPIEKARAKYDKKRKIMGVSFNLETEQELLEKAKAMPDFSGWVKAKLRELD